MNALLVSLLAFVFILVGAFLGLYINRRLPDHHLSEDSKEAIKIGAGLIATLTALVLGLLVSSAKSSFDVMSDEVQQGSADIILLDHTLAKFGPEAMPARDLLRANLTFTLNQIWPNDPSQKTHLKPVENAKGIEGVRDEVYKLKPKTGTERELKKEALKLCTSLAHERWLLIEQSQKALPTPFLVVLIFWLAIFFVMFGLIAPINSTVVIVMVVCTLSVSGAIFLIFEMNHPLKGLIQISSAPIKKTLQHIGER